MRLRDSMTKSQIRGKLGGSRIGKAVLAVLTLFVVFVLLLLFAGPPLIKSYLTDNLSRTLGRKVSVGAVHINPFALSVAIDDLTLAEQDGKTTFVAFKQASVNAQLASIVFFGPVLSELRLTEPYVRLVRMQENTYNFQDLLERFGKHPGEPAGKPAKPLRFSLHNISIVNGFIEFEDRPKGRRHEIRDMNAAIPFLSNLPYRVDEYVKPSFSAVINGAPFHLSGRSKPFETDRESSLKVTLSRLSINEYLPYVPKKLHFTVPGGFLDAAITIAFLAPEGQAPVLQLSGSAAVRDLALDEARDIPTLRVKTLACAFSSIEPLAKRFTLDRIGLSNLELFVRRDREGRINLANLVEPDEEKTPLPYFLLREIDLSEAVVHIRDEQRTEPFETSLRDIRIVARNITSEKGKSGTVELSAAGPERASLKAAADVALEPLVISKLSVRLADLRVRLRGVTTDMIRIGRFDIMGGSLDLDRHSVNIEEVALAESRFNVQRNRKGMLNFREIAGGSEDDTGEKTDAPGPAWRYEVQRLTLGDVGVRWRDDMPAAGPADISIEKIGARVEGISSLPNAVSKLSMRARVGRSGSVAISGSIIASPQMHAKLRVNAHSLPILQVQPYFADKVNVSVTSGVVNALGGIEAKMGKQARILYTGTLQVEKFASVDNFNRNDFLKWETLSCGGMRIDTAPLHVAINDISLNDFYSRLIINPDGSINVQHVMGKEGESPQAVAGESVTPGQRQSPAAAKGQSNTSQPGGTAASSADSPKTAPVVPAKIDRITVRGGHINFSDRFIQPNYSASLTKLAGSIRGLSSDVSSAADVEIRGTVDDAAPVVILGKVNPLSGNLFLDLAASVKGMDLPAATPYSARYAGYPIIKGKISLDVKYRIENRQLRAENRLVLDQLTFGNRVESPSATKLPVLLAVALLKDRNGVIDINLPISGSLDDPQFSLGRIILQVIVNLVTKAVTSPFALIGSLFGGGEELSFIEFGPGRAVLDKTALDKLKTLAKALEERPGLKLDVIGHIDPQADKEGLRRSMMERKLKGRKFDSLAKQGQSPAGLDEIIIDPAEYPQLLKQAYAREKFPKPRSLIGTARDLPVSEMEKLMLANTTVTDNDLRQLALGRARVVANVLVQDGKIGSERVFVVEPKLNAEPGEKEPAEKATAGRVELLLK